MDHDQLFAMHSAAFLLYLLHSEAAGVECASTGLENSFFQFTMIPRGKAALIIRFFNSKAIFRASLMPAADQTKRPISGKESQPKALVCIP